MYSITIKKMGEVSVDTNPDEYRGLFGFAMEDYLVAKGVEKCDVADKVILGFVLDPEEKPDAVLHNVKEIATHGLDPEMIVIGFNLISDEDFLKEVMKVLDEGFLTPYGYEELKDVYSERYVFVKKGINKKTIRFEIVTNNNEGVIDAAMNTFHETFKGLQDYVDNAVIVHTDVPYNGKEFTGSVACVTVDLTAAKQPKECIYRLTDAYSDTIKRNPGVLGDVLNSDKREYIKNPDNPHNCNSSDCAACDKTGCKNHID